MPISAVLSFVATYFTLIVAAVVLLRDRSSFVHRSFAAGMFFLAIEETLRGMSYRAILPEDILYWEKRALLISTVVPAVWLAFSISYSRVNAHAILSKWKWVLVAIGLAPAAFAAAFRRSLLAGSIVLEGPARWSFPLAWPGSALLLFALCISVLVVFNVERTIRSSTGRLRWQIKFMALGIGGLFALRIYLASQSLLYSRLNNGFEVTNAIALLLANLFFTVALSRADSLSMDVYLSRATIQNSITIILTGVYLLSIGVIARITKSLLTPSSLPIDAFVVFLSLTALAVVLLSERWRQSISRFVTQHFGRPQYDYRNVWMDVNKRTTSLLDIHGLSNALARIVSESLNAMSVNVWIIDETKRSFKLVGTTALSRFQALQLENAGKSASALIRTLEAEHAPIDFDTRKFAWAEEIMDAGKEFFGGSKLRNVVRLHAGGELVGMITLNDDRPGLEPLSAEDIALLETLAAQLAGSLLNLKLAARLRQAREVEAFQTVSTFFVHDLKNLASKLSLTMQNLPQHFDNPEFRADALRVISGSLAKIDSMCARLSMLRQNLELKIAQRDVNRMVADALDELKGSLKAVVEQDSKSAPPVPVDAEQVHKVFLNLVLNANEAVNGNGIIQVTTAQEGETVVVAVRDNGCGMSEEFIEKSLFRPFRTTKKTGLGIGLFHCKSIVEAHRGRIEVDSKVGTGTEFRVILPIS